MRIAIVGAHGVGKTTLSKRLSKELNIPVIHDVVIEAFEKGFVINENTPPETQFWLFARQLEEERLKNDFVADKCLIDYSVYADIIFDDHRLKSLLAEMVQKNVNYDHVFYLPIEFPIEDDGVRSTDPQFQKMVDDRYQNILADWGISYEVLSGSVEDRFKKALKKINRQNILVVGGAGYIGSHVAKELINEGHNVKIFDNLSTGLKENIRPGVELIIGDITKPEEISRALKGMDAVVHLAAKKMVGESMEQPEKYSVNNLIGTLNLLNAMAENGVGYLIFSSSAAVYGESQSLPISENHPTEPINYYGFTKLEIERILKWYSKLKNIRFAALRYFNAVGYDHEGEISGLEKQPQNLLPVVMETIRGDREKLQIFGDDYNTPDGTCLRDYIHVNDLATGHAKALDYLIETDRDLIANLGTGQGISVKEIIDEAKRQSGVDFKVEISPRRAGDPARIYADSSLAHNLLSWQPQYSDLKTIIKTTLRAYGIK